MPGYASNKRWRCDAMQIRPTVGRNSNAKQVNTVITQAPDIQPEPDTSKLMSVMLERDRQSGLSADDGDPSTSHFALRFVEICGESAGQVQPAGVQIEASRAEHVDGEVVAVVVERPADG